MGTNILVALKNAIEYKNNDLKEIYKDLKDAQGKNRANNMGDALEYYVKDLFCDTINIHSLLDKEKKYDECLSYLGNSHNPPDFIIKQGAGVEVKKIEGLSCSDLQLNSSFPKAYLQSDSKMLSKKAVVCEDELGGWKTKDMIYTIGNILNHKIRILWFIYGDCYAANAKTYSDLKKKLSEGINKFEGMSFKDSDELGKVYNFDTLNITQLRIRPMWSITHPHKVFKELVKDYNKDKDLQIYVLMRKGTYEKLPKEDKENLNVYIENKILVIENVKIKDPNNKGEMIEAVLLKASIKTKEE